MCLMSAPAAKNRSTAEDTTRTLTSPAASAASSAASSPSSSGPLSALAGGEAIVTRQIPGPAGIQVTTSFGSPIGTCLSRRLYPERGTVPARDSWLRFLASRHREAAAHRQGLAGDEAGLVGGEERDGRADVIRGAEALHRDRADHPGDHLLGVLPGAVGERAQRRGVGRAGTHGVGGDALGGDLAGEGL